ncbi:MAG: chromate transporter [Rhodospirillales bacterium]|nr:chromate transporter [Rhodospirillales bacterium]
MKQFLDLAGVFGYISLLTVGGGMAAFPELKTLTVDTYHWVTFPELMHYYSLGQLAPGPNMMMVASIGAQVAGLPGAAVVLMAFILPTGLLTFGIGRLWTHLDKWPWRASIQRGLGSVAVGLVAAGAIVLARGALSDWLAVVLAVAVFALLMRTKINPAIPIVASGLVGLGVFWLG